MCSQRRAPAGYTWQYATVAPDGQVAVLQSFLDLQLAVDAHFAVGSLLWSLGLLLPCIGRLVGAPALALAGGPSGRASAARAVHPAAHPLAASLFGVALTCRRHRAPATQARRDNLPANSGTAPMTTGYREL